MEYRAFKRLLLGIAITDDGETNKQKAFIRIVSRMLGVSFDSLWKRHKREVLTFASIAILMSIIALALSYWFMFPVKLHIYIKDDVNRLPGMEYGIVKVDGSEYTITHPDTMVDVGSLPGYYRMRNLKLSFKANRYYQGTNALLKITAGFSQSDTLYLHRDSTFESFEGNVYFEDSHGELMPVVAADVFVSG